MRGEKEKQREKKKVPLLSRRLTESNLALAYLRTETETLLALSTIETETILLAKFRKTLVYVLVFPILNPSLR